MFKIQKLRDIIILKCLIFSMFAGLFAFIFVPYIVLQSASAEEINVNIMVNDLSIALDTGTEEGNVDFGSINVDDSGTLLMARKDITVDTTARYYMIYLSSATDSVELKNDKASGSIYASPGTFASPVAFSSTVSASDNTWGYALTEYTTTAGSTSVAKDTNFAQGGKYFVANTGTTLGANGYNSWSARDESSDTHWQATWAGLAPKTSPEKIYYNSTELSGGFASKDASGEDRDWVIICNGENAEVCNSEGPQKFSIYYGAKVNNNLVMGEYKNSVLYTAIASLQDISNNKPEVAHMASAYGGNGDDVKLILNMSTAPKLDASEVKVYFVNHDTYLANFGSYGSTSTTMTDVKLASVGAACLVKEVDTQRSDSSAYVVCAVPALGTALGSTSDVISQPYDPSLDYKTVADRKSYDIIVSVPNYNLKFTTRTTEAQIGFKYVGLQTKDTENNYYVTKMQEMTPGICALTNSFSKTEAINTFRPGDAFYKILNPTTGLYQRVMASNYGKSILDNTLVLHKEALDNLTDTEYKSLLAGTTTNNANWNALTAGQKWEYDLYRNHEWHLTDIRDGKQYVVRKLADDECWMTQNLDLDLTTNITLTSADTDINSYRNAEGKVVSKNNITNTTFTDPTEVLTDANGSPEIIAAAKAAGYEKSWTPAIFNETWKSNHPVLEAERGTRGDYIITQIESKNEYGDGKDSSGNIPDTSKDFRWDQYGADGAHVMDLNVGYYDNSAAKSNVPQVMCVDVASDGKKSVVDCSTATPAGSTREYGIAYTQATHTWKSDSSELKKPNATLIGNWYNFYAATAGSGTSVMTAGLTTDSICPKGWTLAKYSDAGSYVNLIRTTYGGYASNWISAGWQPSAGTRQMDAILFNLPLSFVRSGYYGYSNGALYGRGSNGYFWEGRVHSSTYGNYLYFNSSVLYLQNSSNKGYGFSVRCVAK